MNDNPAQTDPAANGSYSYRWENHAQILYQNINKCKIHSAKLLRNVLKSKTFCLQFIINKEMTKKINIKMCI